MGDTVVANRLSEVGVLKMLKAGVEKAREVGVPMGVCIVDAGGIVRGYVLMEGATALAFDSVTKKARTAAFTGSPSGGLPQDLGVNLAIAITDFANLAGGFPILRNGEVLGGISAGGGSHEQDSIVAEAALAILDLS